MFVCMLWWRLHLKVQDVTLPNVYGTDIHNVMKEKNIHVLGVSIQAMRLMCVLRCKVVFNFTRKWSSV